MDKAIIYGCGRCYIDTHMFLHKKYQILGVVDKKYTSKSDLPNTKLFQDINVICRCDLVNYRNCKILVCLYDFDQYFSVKKELVEAGILEENVIHVPDIVKNVKSSITVQRVLELSGEGEYHDGWGNKIFINGDVVMPENIEIIFEGIDATVVLGSGITVQWGLKIYCGSNTKINIEEGCTFVQTTIFGAWENIDIGRDSMFSFGINIQNHDGHLIFDSETGQRINYPKPVYIGEHVWVGMNATILHGASIGNGAIVGAGSLVVGKEFPEMSSIAGVPAKVIRENVVWSRKWSCLYNDEDMKFL